MLDPEVHVLSRGQGWLFASFRDAYVLDWQTSISIESLDAASAGVHTFVLTQPAGIAVLNVLHGTMKLVSPELRDYSQRKMRESPAGIRCHATALVERGFWAGAMRAAIAGSYMIQNMTFPRRVFSNVHDSIAWCSTVLGHDEAWTSALEATVAQISIECGLSLS